MQDLEIFMYFFGFAIVFLCALFLRLANAVENQVSQQTKLLQQSQEENRKLAERLEHILKWFFKNR